MSEFRMNERGDQLVFSLALEEDVDRIALRMMDSNEIPGLLPVQFFQMDDERTLRYDVTGLTAGKEYLDSGLSVGKVLLFLKDVVQISDGLSEYLIEENELVLDSKAIFVDQEGAPHMACLPVLGREQDQLSAYVRQVLTDTKTMNALRPAERRELNAALDSDSTANKELAQKLEKLELDLALHRQGGRHGAEPLVLQREKGSTDGAGPVVLRRGAPAREAAGKPAEARRPIELHRPSPGEKRSPVTVLRQNPVSLDFEGTSTMNENMPRGRLIRESTGERIEIAANPFRIGKDKQRNHYCISNNPAISRNHAVLTVRENQVYLEDNYSKNYTYVNDRKLRPGEKVPLTNRMVITLANERFLFELDG